jgi:aldehyde:ferredoxin oxidoreductase
MDLYDTGSLIGMVFELYEKGIIDRKTADGLELTWGNERTVRELIRKTAYREGFGDVLAEGLVGAAGRIGKDAQKYCMHVKGIGVIQDPRTNPAATEVFSTLTNLRGEASNVSITMKKRTAEEIRRFCMRACVPAVRIEKILDSPEGYNVGRLTKWVEDMITVIECQGTCYFPFYQRISLNVWSEVYSALTGIEADASRLLDCSQNVWDVKKAFSEREGWSRAEDCVPERFYTDPVSIDGQTFPPLNKNQINSLISDYYEERGWDRNTGTVSPARKKELGLKS